MGMYDSIRVPCPKCGHEDYFQTKGGDCIGGVFTLTDAPADVLSDVNRHSPHQCEKCDTWFSVDPATWRPYVDTARTGDDPYEIRGWYRKREETANTSDNQEQADAATSK